MKTAFPLCSLEVPLFGRQLRRTIYTHSEAELLVGMLREVNAEIAVERVQLNQ